MLRESHRPGIEPMTYKSQVQRPTTEPPRNGILECRLAQGNLCNGRKSIMFKCKGQGHGSEVTITL